MSEARPLVRIVGGGVAGIASAIAHLERGYRVEVLEARDRLGGRAWSKDGVDNASHVILGCYDAFRRVLRELGTEDRFFVPKGLRLTWLDEDGVVHRLEAAARFGPLGMLAGILRLHTVPWSTRLGLLRAGRLAMRGGATAGEDVSQWLAREGVTPRVRSLLFEPLCRAIMNQEPEHASAELFASTLRIAFTSGARGLAMWVPTAAWQDILGDAAERRLAERGVHVQLSARAKRVEVDGSRVALRMADGRRFDDHARLVLAVPWHVAAALDAGTDLIAEAPRLRGVPMLGLHVDLDADDLPCDDAVIAFENGQPFHFVCRRPHPDGTLQTSVPACLVAGGAYPLDGLRQSQIVELGLAQLARFTRRERPFAERTWRTARVVRESNATLDHACKDLERPRPGPTRHPKLWLAGDWTDVGLPSTLEGAARSGFVALEP